VDETPVDETPGAEASVVLRCEGLVRRFGDRVAVGGVGFTIHRGETYGLLGPNGAGKTTTISMVAGVLAPDAGDVTVAGLPMTTRAGEAKAAIGLVPQEIALYQDLTAAENLRFFGRLQRLGGRDLERRIGAVLELVGLADRAKDPVSEFSGGMQRRANIAVGLLHGPRLLVLDEPTAGVDPQSRHQILASIETLGGEGLAVLYTTHYMEEAERLCHRVGIIDQGRIVAEGTHRELVARVGELDRITVRGTGDLSRFAAAARDLRGVASVDEADGCVRIAVPDASAMLAGVVESATASGVVVAGVAVEEPDLEAVFLHLTGRALRD
jgi:ABC-2 type transport system ATP-binding protein